MDPDGNFVNLAAAGIGALIGAGTGAIIAACSGASGREIAAAAVGGAVTGGLAGFTCGASLGVQIAGAALAGTAGYCAENLVAGNEGSVEGMAMAAVGGATGAMAGAILGEVVSSVGNKLNTPQVHIDSAKYPETAQHIKDAQNNGYPSKLTIDRAGAKTNRAESLRGYNKVPGKQLDEYPPAMFKEGGRGADIRAISPKDNMGAGASMGNQLRNYPDGTVIKMVVD